MREYPDRGWTFTESCWASLTKDYDFSLDLGGLTGEEKGKRAIVAACTRGGQVELAERLSKAARARRAKQRA